MTMITSERIEQGVQVVSTAARLAARESFDNLVARGVLREENFQRILSQGDKVKAKVATALTEFLAELAENLVGRLKLISGGTKLTIKATSGGKMIAGSTDVFQWGIHGDFVNYGCDVASKPAPEVGVDVYEMIKDGTFAQIYGGFGENTDRLCFTQEQIIEFVLDEDNRKWLRADGYATFFLFKEKIGDKDQFFVAHVYVYSDGTLHAYVDRLSSSCVWRAGDGHRFVIPQLIPAT